ncbi:hypothetical protein V5799_007089 [Amblyomma americanum]|uniref:Amiloride-sensitive sodium channel n=1 Tax=Amblyomma americanum TaxID=6943 RepID=A0AAQ4DUJ0_AMBAM
MSEVRHLGNKPAKVGMTAAERLGTDDEDDEVDYTFGSLNRHFAERCTAHGFNRIASTQRLRRLLWVIVVVVAVGGFLYHISFLTTNYFSYPIMTATEEVHADELHFPAITVCNLNIMRKSSFEDYLKDTAARAGYPSAPTTTGSPNGATKAPHTKTRDMFSPTTKGYSSASGGDDEEGDVCYKTVDEFLKSSRTMDLSDMWMNFYVTKDQLLKFGHKANELVVQCTYNARNCFDESFTIGVKICMRPRRQAVHPSVFARREVRYDLTTSQSEWPNFRQQSWAIKRWPLLNKRLQDAGIHWQDVLNATDDRTFMDELVAFRGNFMRVHIFIQEMNYLYVRDLPAYPLPQLFADLGGCLGLYIGVSAITIFEFLEHLVTLISHLCDRYLGCGKKRPASPRAKAEWTYPPLREEKVVEHGGGRKPWSFLVRDREYPVLGRAPSRSPLFRTVYSSPRDYAGPAPTRRPLYLGYTVPQHVDEDGGFFGRRFQT